MERNTRRNQNGPEQTKVSAEVYTPQYFKELGFTQGEARFFAERWSVSGPQSFSRVHQSVITEGSNREKNTEISSK